MATKKKVKDEALEIKSKTAMEDNASNENDAGVTSTDGTQNIDFSVLRKKRFRIDGDDSRILYLDTSDFSILKRIEECAPKMSKLIGEAFSVDETADRKSNMKSLDEVDKKMRDLLDYVFDSKVAEVCAPTGYMFDLFNGEFRFEHILQTLLKLYEANIEKEFHDLNRKIANYTKKYTGKK